MKYILSLIILGIFVFLPAHAYAQVTLSFQGPAQLREGQASVISVVATLTEAINALSGTIVYDPTRIQVSSLQDVESPVQLWLTRPQVRTPGVVVFEGVVPGGIGPALTDRVVLFRMIIMPSGGTARFDVKDLVIYLNQPQPRLAQVSVKPGVFPVSTDAPLDSRVASGSGTLETDIRIASIPDTGGSAQMLVFNVHRDGASVPELSIRERWLGVWGAWHPVISPYRLSDQAGVSIIEVRVPGSTTNLFQDIPVRLYALWLGGILLIAILIRNSMYT